MAVHFSILHWEIPWTEETGRLYKRKVKVPQLCLTLCDPMDYIVHGILQVRILECVAYPFSSGFSQPRIEVAKNQTQLSN